jgi:hypothetical protein
MSIDCGKQTVLYGLYKRSRFKALEKASSRPCTELVADDRKALFFLLSGESVLVGPGVRTSRA